MARKLAFYFPARLIITSLFFSWILLENFSFLQTSENSTLLILLHFFKIPSYLNVDIYIGGLYAPVIFSPPLHMQILFVTFFGALAISTANKLGIRLKIFGYGILCAASFLVLELFIIVVSYWLHVGSYSVYLYGISVITSMVGAFFVETCLFANMTLPKGQMIRPVIKRSYIDEYLYLFFMLVTSSILLYALVTFLQIDARSLTFSYLILNVSIIISLNNFLAYFLIETKVPDWLRKNKPHIDARYGNVPISFLLPAYNEEKTIRRCIESIDRAASNYQGTTEIIVVNDGSTDDTRKIASDAILNLKNSSGKVFNIPNSGKGFALRYGLMKISGDVVFRMDTDSILDEKAIGHVVNHFRDPLVGSVSGMILPMEEKSIWQKITFLDFIFVYMFYKKEEELMDSIMVQSGAFSVFRMDALLKVGGWLDNRFGEDGEITFRLGRYGYKNEIEPRAIAMTDQPGEFHNFREQRVRWSMGYYYTRSTHFGLFKEFRGPRTIMYALTMYVHGLDFTYAISLPFFILGLVIEYFDHTIPKSVIFDDLYRIIIIDVLLFALQHVFHLYYICKFKRFDLVPYIPLMRLYSLVHQMLFRTEALEILLTWSSRWRVHNKESFHALRKTLKASMMR